MKCLTYNIQAGVGTKNYFDYLFNAHQQIISTNRKRKTIENIARLISEYDIIMLQEVDLGGRRNSFENQARQLQQISKHKYLISQTNRIVPNLSLHGNIILSNHPLELLADKKLPGKFESKNTGRGILVVKAMVDNVEYCIANTHFSLGKVEQALQFNYVKELLKEHKNVILVGDFNCSSRNINYQNFIKQSGLIAVTNETHIGYPSWHPTRILDHVFVSPSIGKVQCNTIKSLLSDHLPVAFTLEKNSAKGTI